MKELFDVSICIDEKKETKYVLSISEFRDKKYISIRKWFKDYTGEFRATSEGVTFPYTLSSTQSLYWALTAILSDSETLHQVVEDKEILKMLLHKSSIFDKIAEQIELTENSEVVVTYVSNTKAIIEVVNK